MTARERPAARRLFPASRGAGSPRFLQRVLQHCTPRTAPLLKGRLAPTTLFMTANVAHIFVGRDAACHAIDIQLRWARRDPHVPPPVALRHDALTSPPARFFPFKRIHHA